MWWGEGVTFYNGAVDQDEKKNLMKKNRNESRDEGVGKRADEEERKKNAIRTLRATRKKKKEKENERNKEKKKKIEKEEIYKGRNTHSPPTCTRI